MDDSHTNRPPATEPDLRSPLLGVEDTEKPPENTPTGNDVISSTPGAQTSLPPQPSQAIQLFNWITESIVAQIHLPESVRSLVAFWVISTWFQDALNVLPCLVITGPAHEAMVLLHILKNFCRSSALLAEFKRGDLKDLNWSFHTVLISEPNLNNRTAALLGNLTNPGFIIVDQRYYLRCAASRAIYLGEDLAVRRIQHSIHIHIIPTNAEPPSPPQWLQQNIEYIPGHLNQYRERNLDQVGRSAFTPSGLPPEPSAIAKALGSCIVDAPELQGKLVGLLKAQDQQHLSQRSDTAEVVVVEAALALSHKGREHAYVREIAVEANRLLEARGEGLKLSPEKVGHRLRKLGLPTRRLTHAGNGLVLDNATIARIQQLASVYVGEDLLAETENLHCSQTTDNKDVSEVM